MLPNQETPTWLTVTDLELLVQLVQFVVQLAWVESNNLISLNVTYH